MCRLIQGRANARGSGCVLPGTTVARIGIGRGESPGSARSPGDIEGAADAVAAAIEDGCGARFGSAVVLKLLLGTNRLPKSHALGLATTRRVGAEVGGTRGNL